MKLIIFPLLFLITFAALAQLGLGTQSYATNKEALESDFIAPADGWYDVDGHQVMDKQGRWVGERGYDYGEGNQLWWQNATNSELPSGSPDPAGTSQAYPLYDLLEGDSLSSHAEGQSNIINVGVFGTWGLIGLMVGIMALAAVVGLRVFGSGISEGSVTTIIKGTAYLSVWALFSLAAYPLIIAVPLLGILFYFFITALYCLGIVNQIGGGPAGE